MAIALAQGASIFEGISNVAEDAARYGYWAVLLVVAGDGVAVEDALPAVKAVSTPVVTNFYFLERTLLERPEHYDPQQFSLVLARVPTA